MLSVPRSDVDKDAIELLLLMMPLESVATVLVVALSPVDRDATELLVMLRLVESDIVVPEPEGLFDSCDTLVERDATELFVASKPVDSDEIWSSVVEVTA